MSWHFRTAIVSLALERHCRLTALRRRGSRQRRVVNAFGLDKSAAPSNRALPRCYVRSRPDAPTLRRRPRTLFQFRANNRNADRGLRGRDPLGATSRTPGSDQTPAIAGSPFWASKTPGSMTPLLSIEPRRTFWPPGESLLCNERAFEFGNIGRAGFGKFLQSAAGNFKKILTTKPDSLLLIVWTVPSQR